MNSSWLNSLKDGLNQLPEKFKLKLFIFWPKIQQQQEIKK